MEVVNIRYLGNVADTQEYNPLDVQLISTASIVPTFGATADYIESFTRDLNGTILGINYNVTSYSPGSVVNSNGLTYTAINLDPEQDVKDQGIDRGSVTIKYNFYKKLLNTSPIQQFWIKDISPSRTEIKVARQDLSNTALLDVFNSFNGTLTAANYYPDFLLNFGQDIEIIGVNCVYALEGDTAYLIFKLYEPLPVDYDLKSQFWVVQKIAESVEYEVTIDVATEQTITNRQLRGPNYKININQKVGQTTPYYNYTNLFSTTVTSSYQQIKSLFDEKGIDINVDYSKFDNFIHFSSATERLLNFEYKVRLIEAYRADINAGSSMPNVPSSVISSSNAALQQKIDTIITKFDGYEYYLYFESASTAWPKETSRAPYTLYSVTSSQVLNWLGSPDTVPTTTGMSMLYSSSLYDNLNKDNLQYSMPAYIREDDNNQPYMTFLNMIGQHFDNIWIYYKDVSNRYSAENNPHVGISQDLVADALRGFGMQLYTNTNISDNIYYSLLGLNDVGSNLPLTSSTYAQYNPTTSKLTPPVGSDYLSQSLYLPPFGNEKLNEYVTNPDFQTIAPTQLEKEIYKRLYHNLPYLLKTKGTQRGVKALIACFGIPNSILTVNEFGGNNIFTAPGIQQVQNEKVFTGSLLQIQGTQLTPTATNQYYINDQERGSIDIEVGFSPADSINADISSSLGNFNIMQYIGNPALQYSSSYDPLVALSNSYFASNYTNRYNVWDFIRIIKFYNNSLFKMIQDFVPARANLSSGIIIKPHILERSKYARHEPQVTTSSNLGETNVITITGSDGGCIIGSTTNTRIVHVQYTSASGYLSRSLGTFTKTSTDGVEKYTGELGGATIKMDVANFSQTERSTYNIVPPFGKYFTTYSLGALYQNVSSSVKSQRFLRLEYQNGQIRPSNYDYVTASIQQSTQIGSVSQSEQPYSQYAEIQDYNYNAYGRVHGKYSGSLLSGLYYNKYASKTGSYAGDISYGTDPVINHYVNKLGLFTQVATSSFLPGKVDARLGYLADVSGGLFELNQINKHWTDIQNTFKANTTLTIKQFDNKKYSNQKATDGVKYIYSSGYSYTPQLYFASASDNTLYFTNGILASDSFVATNKGTPNFNIHGGSPNTYQPAANGYIYNVFDSKVGTNEYHTGSATLQTFPYYSPRNGKVIQFKGNFTINVTVPNYGNSVTYTFDVKKQGVSILPGGQPLSQTFTGTFIANIISLATISPPSIPGTIIGRQYYPNTAVTLVCPITITKTSGGSQTFGNPGQTVQIQDCMIRYDNGFGNVNQLLVKVLMPTTDPILIAQGYNTYINFQIGGSATPNYCSPTYTVGVNGGGTNTGSLYFDLFNGQLTPAQQVNFGEKVEFQLRETWTGAAPSTSTIDVGNLTSVVTITGYSAAHQNLINGPFLAGIVGITPTQSELILSAELSQYLDFTYVPYYVAGGSIFSSSLYSQYGDVNVPFHPETDDKIVLEDIYGITQELNVVTTYLQSGQLHIVVLPGVYDSWVIDYTLVAKMLILRRYKDEQNVILLYNKPPGATSYGFLIPDKINPQVTAQINELQAAVQTQLLSQQAL